eukprot:gene10141-biopygen4910
MVYDCGQIRSFLLEFLLYHQLARESCSRLLWVTYTQPHFGCWCFSTRRRACGAKDTCPLAWPRSEYDTTGTSDYPTTGTSDYAITNADPFWNFWRLAILF